MGVSAASSTEANVVIVVPSTATASDFYCYASAAPGTTSSGKQWALTVRINGVDTAITATIFETSQSASDTAHTALVTAGDRITVKVVPSGTPTAARIVWGLNLTT